MGFQVSSLPDYVEQHRSELLTQAALGAPTIKHINIQTGVKYESALNILSASVALQARTCGFNSNGTVSYTQRVIKVGAYKVNISLCTEDLRKKWMNIDLVTRAGGDALPFEEKVTGEIVKNIKKQIESKIWTASTANGDLFNGLLTICRADATAVTSAATTIWGKIQDVYKALPTEVLDRAAIFVGVDTYRDFILELVAANMYHYDGKLDPENMELYLPGTSARVIAVAGLNGTQAIVGGDPENFVYGCDMQDDEEEFDLFYSQDNQEFRFVSKFNAGTQIAFPADVRYIAPAGGGSSN